VNEVDALPVGDGLRLCEMLWVTDELCVTELVVVWLPVDVTEGLRVELVVTDADGVAVKLGLVLPERLGDTDCVGLRVCELVKDMVCDALGAHVCWMACRRTPLYAARGVHTPPENT
jgi:hypothetical protein